MVVPALADPNSKAELSMVDPCPPVGFFFPLVLLIALIPTQERLPERIDETLSLVPPSLYRYFPPNRTAVRSANRSFSTSAFFFSSFRTKELRSFL